MISRWLSDCIDLWDWDVNYLNLMKLRIIYLVLTVIELLYRSLRLRCELSQSHEVTYNLSCSHGISPMLCYWDNLPWAELISRVIQCGWTRNVTDIDFVDHEVDQQNNWWNRSWKLIEMKEKWISWVSGFLSISWCEEIKLITNLVFLTFVNLLKWGD